MAKGAMHGYSRRDGASRKEGNATLSHLSIKEGENGGHIITHHFNNSGMGPYVEPKEYPFSKEEGGKALDHIAKHANIKDDED